MQITFLSQIMQMGGRLLNFLDCRGGVIGSMEDKVSIPPF